jgi:Protein of unknown function (DUF2281)
MGYAELISRLQVLPEAKQAEVFDFVEFLASREASCAPVPLTLGQTTWAELLKNPVRIPDFTPLSREQANER